MPNPPASSDFRDELRAQIARAEKRGAPHVEINSGELHRAVGGYPGTDHRMPICCDVMQSERNAADEIISPAPGRKERRSDDPL
jgi:hypothetical protein